MEDIKFDIVSNVDEKYYLREPNITKPNKFTFKNKMSQCLEYHDELLIGSSVVSQMCSYHGSVLDKAKIDFLAKDRATVKDLCDLARKISDIDYNKITVWIGSSEIISDNYEVLKEDISRDLLSLLSLLVARTKKLVVIVEQQRKGLKNFDNKNIKIQNFNRYLNGYIKQLKVNKRVQPIAFNQNTTFDGETYKDKAICAEVMKLLLEQ